MNALATAIRDTKAGDLVAVTHTDGTVFVEPVVERRRGGLRFSVRSGFGAQDLFIPFGNIAAIKALS